MTSPDEFSMNSGAPRYLQHVSRSRSTAASIKSGPQQHYIGGASALPDEVECSPHRYIQIMPSANEPTMKLDPAYPSSTTTCRPLRDGEEALRAAYGGLSGRGYAGSWIWTSDLFNSSQELGGLQPL
jgi:hypothetical protein